MLDAQATGTIEFDTGTLSFNSTSAMVERTSGYAGAPGYTVVKNPGDADYSAGDSRISRSGDQPAVLANADFDITGTLGNTSLATIAGGTPHVNLGFGGMTLDSATVNSVTPILTGTTVVMATHDQRIVNMMRKRVIQLDRGIIVRDQARGVYE